jgi:biotin transport system substrate-specific component
VLLTELSRKIRYVVLVLAGTALIALCAQISVPFFPVPLTLQTFAVFLIGLSFGWRLGGITVALYLLEGALGLPVFAGGKGGLIVFMGPTAGYLAGFFLAATACGRFAERGFDRSYSKLLASLLVGNILLYAPGLLWLGSLIGWDKPVLEYGLYPFILGDLLKIAMAVLLLPTAWKIVNRMKQ